MGSASSWPDDLADRLGLVHVGAGRTGRERVAAGRARVRARHRRGGGRPCWAPCWWRRRAWPAAGRPRGRGDGDATLARRSEARGAGRGPRLDGRAGTLHATPTSISGSPPCRDAGARGWSSPGPTCGCGCWPWSRPSSLYTALYVLWDGWSLSDALYMTVITLTTVGFKEVRELDDVGRLITMAAAFSGAALIFGGVGIMAETLVADLTSGRRERRRMQQRVDAMTGHYIVCGYGRVGSTVARELRQSGRAGRGARRLPGIGGTRARRTAMRSSRVTRPTTRSCASPASSAPPASSPPSIPTPTTSTWCSPRARSTRACSSWGGRRRRPRRPSSSTRAPTASSRRT